MMYILLLFVLFLVELLTGPTGKEEASVFVIYFYLSFVFCFLQNSAVSKINVYKLRERGLVLINNVHIH